MRGIGETKQVYWDDVVYCSIAFIPPISIIPLISSKKAVSIHTAKQLHKNKRLAHLC